MQDSEMIDIANGTIVGAIFALALTVFIRRRLYRQQRPIMVRPLGKLLQFPKVHVLSPQPNA